MIFEHQQAKNSCSPHTHEQARLRIEVTVSGDQVTDIKRIVFVPEKWVRNDKDYEQLRKGIHQLVTLFGYSLIGLAALYAFITFQWSWFAFLIFGLILIGLALFNLVNIYDVLAFKLETSQSMVEQLFRSYSFLTALMLILAIMQAMIVAWFYKIAKSENKYRHTDIAIAVAIGGVCAALLSLMDRISHCCVPSWAQYVTAALVWPLAGTAVHVIDLFVTTTVKLSAWVLISNSIGSYARKQTALATISIAVITILTAAILAEPSLNHDIIGWVIGTSGFSIILGAAYYILFRYDVRMVIPTAATFVIVTQIKQLVLHAFPGAWKGTFAGLILVAIISFLLLQATNQHNRKG